MSYFAMFAIAFGMELCGAGYTIAIARGHDNWAVLLSALNAVFGWGLMLYVVYDVQLFPAAIAGEVVGTMAAMRLAHRRRRT